MSARKDTGEAPAAWEDVLSDYEQHLGKKLKPGTVKRHMHEVRLFQRFIRKFPEEVSTDDLGAYHTRLFRSPTFAFRAVLLFFAFAGSPRSGT